MKRSVYLIISTVCFYAALGTIVCLLFVNFWLTVAVVCCMFAIYCSITMFRSLQR